jgi:hypothetical protein
MALCIMSKCRGAGFEEEATFRHSQECGNEDRVAKGRLISNKLV